MSYFLGSNRCYRTCWGSRDLFGVTSTGQSRSSLPCYLRLQHFRSLSRYCCKVLSPQLSKISKIASKSAMSVFDFLRLAINFCVVKPLFKGASLLMPLGCVVSGLLKYL